MSLAVTPVGSVAFDVDAEGLGLVLRQGLRGHDVLDFAGADAEGQGAEGSVGAGVGVAADDGHAGFGEAELGADDVDDALVGRLDVEELDAEVGAVFAQGFDLFGGDLVDDVEAVFDAAGGDVVVDGGEGAVGAAELAAGQAEAVEGLRAGDLVDEMEVDVEDRGFACGLGYEVLLPDFFEEGFGVFLGGSWLAFARLVGGERCLRRWRLGGGTWCGVPSGSTRMALRMCWMMALPEGSAVQRAMLWARAAGMWSGSMAWLGKIQSVYSAPGSLGVLLSLIQSMAAKTTSGCGAVEVDPEHAARGTEAEDAAGDGEVAVVVGDDFVGDREEVERGLGERLIAGLRIAPEGLRSGEVLREEGRKRVSRTSWFSRPRRVGARIARATRRFLWAVFFFLDLLARRFGVRGRSLRGRW